MIWAKRQFEYAGYAPYQDRLGDLQLANASVFRQFIMVSVNTSKPGVSEVIIGLPNKTFLPLFDGFEEIPEGGLPKEIDTLLLADVASDEFNSRFKFRERRER
jgi:hypothetical protein